MKKYPIGTKIRFIGSVREDIGQVGSIVGLSIYDSSPLIYLPTSSNHVTGERYTWSCCWNEIELLKLKKNEQLLFEFMHE